MCIWGLLWLYVYALFYVMLKSLDALELLVRWWQQVDLVVEALWVVGHVACGFCGVVY